MSKSSSNLPIGALELLDAAPVAVVVHDLSDTVLYWNAAAELLYGWSLDEVQERPMTRVFYVEPDERKAAREVLEREGTWRGELRQINSKGDEYIIDCQQQLILDNVGKPVAVLCFNSDVTGDKKKIDAEERAHFVKSSEILAGGIAHELNNALAPILLSAAIIKRNTKEDKTRSMVEMIEKCANRGSEMINQLLSYERGKGGGVDTVRPSHVERLLERAIEETVPKAIHREVDIASNLWDFRARMDNLKDVFCAIILNACEAMPDGGRLTVNVSNFLFDENFEALAPEAKAGPYLGFEFTDTGYGISRDHLGRVAEPFFTTKQPKAGHGFGLSNVQAVIKGLQGFMIIESESGAGTTLKLYFPAEPPKAETAAGVETAKGEGRLVLVADDEFFVRETIKKTLEQNGYGVILAEDGTEALMTYASRGNEIALVVTNVDMPFMDGPALCRALKKMDPEVKILISSGHKKQDKIAEVQSVGVEHFLSKPYTAENLAVTVGKILA